MNNGRFIHLENNEAIGQGQFIGKPTSKKNASGLVREIRHKYKASDGTGYTFIHDLKTEKWRLSGFDDAAFSIIMTSYKTRNDLLNAVEGAISRRINISR